MTRRSVTRDSDGATLDLDKQEAEQADTTAKAKQVKLVDSTGADINSGNPLPVDTEISVTGDVIVQDVDINDISAGTQTNDVKITLDSENVVLGTNSDTTYIGDIKFGESLPTGTNTIGSIKITDGTDNLDLDPIHGGVPIEGDEHYHVHRSEFYTVSDFDNSVDTASPKYWHIITPDSAARSHMRIQLATDTGGLVELFENPTTTGNGTSLTAYNNDRNSVNNTTINFYYDPTVSYDGARIEVSRIGAGREKKFGGMARQNSELILKQNEQYLIKVTPDSNAAEVTINIGFYEV